MPHGPGKYHPDEGRVQPVIILKEDEDGMFSARDVVGQETGTVQDVNIVSSEIPFGGGGGGDGVDPVSIKDGTDPTRKLAVDASGRIGINNLPATQPVSGSVSVSNFPATQPISGTVTVSNPTAAPETGLAKEVTLESLRADIANGISAAISNFPATQPVSGTVAVSNFPATQPISGTVAVSNMVAQGLTDAQLRATPVPISGTVAIGSGATYLYKGRASTPITPGRAGTAGHMVFTIWNGSASRIIELNLIGVDLYQTAAKVIGTPPPAIRFFRVTAAPINGATLTKVAEDTALSSDAGIVLRGDASADRTSAASALAATVTGGALNQEYAPRLFTAAGYEMYDKTIFFDQSPMILRPSEGMAMRLEYAAAVSNPVTDMWIVNTIWYER